MWGGVACAWTEPRSPMPGNGRKSWNGYTEFRRLAAYIYSNRHGNVHQKIYYTRPDRRPALHSLAPRTIYYRVAPSPH